MTISDAMTIVRASATVDAVQTCECGVTWTIRVTDYLVATDANPYDLALSCPLCKRATAIRVADVAAALASLPEGSKP